MYIINNKISYWLAQGKYVCTEILKDLICHCLKISWSFIFVSSIAKLSAVDLIIF